MIKAVKRINNNSTIALSGFSYMNPPMELVREIIRQKKKNLTLISGPTSGIETDMLIGAGCVKQLITACVSFEKICSVAPNFKKFYEEDKIKLWECDEAIWHLALKAGIENKKFIFWEGAVGTSIPELNRDILEVKRNEIYYLKIPAIKPDFSIVHCTYADKDGNLAFTPNLFRGRMFCEKELVKAGKVVIAQVEKIVEKLPKNKDLHIGKANHVFEIPKGCYPGASNGMYAPDLDHYKLYVDYCNKNKFQEYLEKYVYIRK